VGFPPQSKCCGPSPPVCDAAPVERFTPLPSQHVASMAAMDRSYWWHRERIRFVVTALRRAGVMPGGSLADLGCGTGGTTQELAQALGAVRALGVDGDPECLRVTAERGIQTQQSALDDSLALPFAPDVVTCLDVLEHLEAPEVLLQKLRTVVKPGTVLAVTVPALQTLFSGWDVMLGHRRRYTRETLHALLERGGWAPLEVRYFFGWGLVPAAVRRLRHPPDRPTENAEFPVLPPLINGLLTGVCRAEALVTRNGRFTLAGVSLAAVARVAGAS